MRIKITKIKDSPEYRTVYFEHNYGIKTAQGAGKWLSKKPPLLDCYYYIEINISQSLDQLLVFSEKVEHDFNFQINENHVKMTGYVDSIDHDNMLYFRVADSCLIMLEAGNKRVNIGQWLSLTIDAEKVEIFGQKI